eukprot:scaffold388_cov244-Pinguiococcus_pyrenoidosus.AAC.39
MMRERACCVVALSLTAFIFMGTVITVSTITTFDFSPTGLGTGIRHLETRRERRKRRSTEGEKQVVELIFKYFIIAFCPMNEHERKDHIVRMRDESILEY